MERALTKRWAGGANPGAESRSAAGTGRSRGDEAQIIFEEWKESESPYVGSAVRN